MNNKNILILIEHPSNPKCLAEFCRIAEIFLSELRESFYAKDIWQELFDRNFSVKNFQCCFFYNLAIKKKLILHLLIKFQIF